MKKTVLLSLGMLLGLPMLAAQTDTVVSSHLTNSAGQPLSGYVYFQPALTNGQPTWYRMPGGGTVSSNPVQVTVTNGALSVTLPDTTQTYPSNICFVMSYPGGVLANGYNCLQPHTTAYTASDWCQAGVCNLDNYLPGSQPLASINAVQSINYIAGQITFTGSGFSQSGNTFTFTAGSGCIAQGAAGTLQASTGAGTCVAATAGNIETGLGFTPAASGANSDITSLSAITTPLSASQGGTGGDGTGYAHGNGGSAFTYSPTIPYGVLTGTPTIPTSANWPNAGNCSTGQYLESLANGVAPPTGCAQVQYAQLGGTVPTFNQNTTGSAGGLTGCSTSTAGSICYWSGSAWTVFAGNSSGSNFLQENASGVPSWAAGGGGDSITSPNSTLSVGGTSSATTLDINLAHANTWTAIQTFGTDISIGGIQPSGATGTGNLVFGTSPTLVTPILGIPTSGTLTNTTGYLWNNLTNPTGTLSLTLPAADTTTFTWSAAASPSTVDWTWTAGADTGTSTVSTFIFDDTTGNTRTGPLIDIHSVGTSTILPVRFTAQGTANGVDMTSAGLLQAIGSGGINATELSGKSLTGSGAGVTSGPTSDASSDIATFTGTVGQIQDSEVQIGTTGSDVLQLSGGLVPSVNLPKATTSAFGAVEGDNSTITLSSGVISCTTATTSQLGCVKPDGTIITDTSGAITVAKGSHTAFGVVEVDNTTITASSGVISAVNTGTVTSIATTSPITGGTITSTGTIACATCVTSAASLTNNALMTGAGSQASQTVTTGTGVVTALGDATNGSGGFLTQPGASQYSEFYSNGATSAILGLAAPTTNADWLTGYHITGSAASAPINEELVASTTNSIGITITPTYNATGPTQRFEATGTYTGNLAESQLTGSAAATSITETATGDAIARIGVETGNLTAPYVFTNGNSTNNNTDIGLLVGATGSSTGGIGEVVFDVSGTGDIMRWYTGGSVSAGVYTIGTLEAHLSNAGALTLTGGLTATGANLSGLTASLPVCTDGSKNLSSTCTGLVTLADLATQTADTMVANMTASTASPTAVAIPTTAHGVWLGEGTATAPGITAAGGSNFPLIGQGSSADPVFSTIAYPTSLTSGGLIYGSSTTALASDANATISAGTLSLGASGTLGAFVLGNATSGTLTVEPATGAITSYTLELPVAQPSGSNTYLSCTAANPAVCTWATGGGVTAVTATSPVASSGGTTPVISINANGITASQLAAQYSKGSCTEVWVGSGTSNALQSGDDAVSDNTCYNDSGVTRTITAVKCRSDNASNTTTINPTFGSAGTGTTILSSAITCGNSYAYSSSGTVTNASWTTGSGIDPAMGGTLTGTSIAVIVEYMY